MTKKNLAIVEIARFFGTGFLELVVNVQTERFAVLQLASWLTCAVRVDFVSLVGGIGQVVCHSKDTKPTVFALSELIPDLCIIDRLSFDVNQFAVVLIEVI